MEQLRPPPTTTDKSPTNEVSFKKKADFHFSSIFFLGKHDGAGWTGGYPPPSSFLSWKKNRKFSSDGREREDGICLSGPA